MTIVLYIVYSFALIYQNDFNGSSLKVYLKNINICINVEQFNKV
jgi:hypothetical protein